MLFHALLLLVSVFLASAGSPARVHYSRLTVPSGWSTRGSPAPHTEIPIVLAVRQQNVDALKSLFHSVSNPENPAYGKFLSLNEVNELLAPAESTVNNIRSWLAHHEVAADAIQFPSPDFLVLPRLPVSIAERLFHCEMRVFEHSQSGDQRIRCADGYSLPVDIDSAVDFVGGINRLHKAFHAAAPEPLENVPAYYNVTPQWMHNWYNIPSDAVGTNPQNSQAVIEFLDQYYSDEDLQSYFRQFNVPMQRVSEVFGPNNQSQVGGEAQLDIEVIMAIGANVPTHFWSFGGLRDNSQPPSEQNQEPFLNWMLKLASTAQAPLVHSVSYDDPEIDVPSNYTQRCDIEFMKAAVRGLTLLFAAGDDGIGGEDVREGNTSCIISQPAWPSSSPYVTSVGGTQLNQAQSAEITSSSTTGSRITTGGGFSFRYSRSDAPWQSDAVAQYFESASSSLPPTGVWNPMGRGYPDVSAMATNYQIVMNGQTRYIGGTSASTPLIGGMIALINDIRLNNGKTPMGFLNYWLYQTMAKDSQAFNDITVGNNACSAEPKYCCPYSFSAAPGWDAVTGVGTPSFQTLLKHI